MTGNNYAALADKIEEGCKLSEPLKNAFVRHSGGLTWACALGAAAIACEPNADGRSNLRHILLGCTGIDIWTRVTSPVYSHQGNESLDTVIMSLNDSAEWSRERIAAWLRTLP